MKKQKNIDSLLASLENQEGALMGKGQGKSIQYWCGLNVTGGDFGSMPISTGSQLTDTPDNNDSSDC